jgi:hypothetical protein
MGTEGANVGERILEATDDSDDELELRGANGFSSSLVNWLPSLGRTGKGMILVAGIDGVSGMKDVEGKTDGMENERFLEVASVDGLFAEDVRGYCGPPYWSGMVNEIGALGCQRSKNDPPRGGLQICRFATGFAAETDASSKGEARPLVVVIAVGLEDRGRMR